MFAKQQNLRRLFKIIEVTAIKCDLWRHNKSVQNKTKQNILSGPGTFVPGPGRNKEATDPTWLPIPLLPLLYDIMY